jgi:hypothetical protein
MWGNGFINPLIIFNLGNIGTPKMFLAGREGILTLRLLIMFDFKNYVMKIMSKSPSPHVVKLQGKQTIPM